MATLSEIVLGRRARRSKAAPPANARRSPPEPAPPARPQRRAEREPERASPPAKRADTIKGIVVSPAERTIEEVELATEPGNPANGYGTQLADGEVEKIVGADAAIEPLDLSDSEVVLVDMLRQSEAEEAWSLGDDEPIVGTGVILSYDPKADAYADTTMSLADVRSRF